MSALTDLVEKIKSSGAQIFEKIQETGIYIKLKERYDGLPAYGQKAVLALASFMAVAFLFSIPLSSYWLASDSVTSFEEKRNLIQDLFRVRTEAQVSLPVDPPPPLDQLKSQIEMKLQQAQLTPEQLKGVSFDSVPQAFSRDSFDGALSVSLSKLNLRQVIDIGFDIQNISTGIKMVDLIIQANSTDTRYFDVLYKFLTLKVPQFSEPPAPQFDNRPGRRPLPKDEEN